MNWIAEDAISLLMFLAPGLVVVVIFRSLTAFPPPRVFEQVVQALVCTIIVQTVCEFIVELYGIIGGKGSTSWTIPYPPYLSFPVASALAILLAVTYGNDTIHGYFRRLRLTRETSFSSEWYSAFHRNLNCHVLLHLAKERYVYVWPEEWPSQPEKGHFRLLKYTWLTRDEVNRSSFNLYPEQGIPERNKYRKSILIPVSEVIIVEFIGIHPKDES